MKPKVVKVVLKGMGENQYGVQDGIWLTEKQFNELVEKIYNPDLCDKPVNYGGRWFVPTDFKKAVEQREFNHELVKYSGTMGTALLESLAEEGYLPEVKRACLDTGYSSFVDKLVDSGKYKMLESNNEPHTNPENVKRIEQLKREHGLI